VGKKRPKRVPLSEFCAAAKLANVRLATTRHSDPTWEQIASYAKGAKGTLWMKGDAEAVQALLDAFRLFNNNSFSVAMMPGTTFDQIRRRFYLDR
jgi:hypothetical protein